MGALLGAFGMKILGIVLPSLATVIGGLVAGILVKQLKKLGLELDAKQEDALKAIISDAIKAADEAARRNPAMTSDEKRQLAENIVRSKARDIGPVDLHLAIDAALPEVRAQLGEQRKFPVPSTPGTFGRRE